MNLERFMQAACAIGGAAWGVTIGVHAGLNAGKGLAHDIGFAFILALAFGIIGAMMGFNCGLPAAFLLGLLIIIPFYALEGIKKVFHLPESGQIKASPIGLQSDSNRESPPSNPRRYSPRGDDFNDDFRSYAVEVKLRVILVSRSRQFTLQLRNS